MTDIPHGEPYYGDGRLTFLKLFVTDSHVLSEDSSFIFFVFLFFFCLFFFFFV